MSAQSCSCMSRSRYQPGRPHRWEDWMEARERRERHLLRLHAAEMLDGQHEWLDHEGIYHDEAARIRMIWDAALRHHRGRRRTGDARREERELRRYRHALEMDAWIMKLLHGLRPCNVTVILPKNIDYKDSV